MIRLHNTIVALQVWIDGTAGTKNVTLSRQCVSQLQSSAATDSILGHLPALILATIT